MSEFLVDADTLARARFGLSQVTETVAALKLLLQPVDPWFRSWKDTHVTAFEERLAAEPVWAAVIDSAFGRRWTADFLTQPPLEPGLAFAAELTQLTELDDDRIRADLSVVRTPLPPLLLTTSGLSAGVGELLTWVWTHTVEPDWPRRRRVLQADVVSRTAKLSEQGWAGVLSGLGPDVRWIGDGRIQVNSSDFPITDVRGQDLMFIAAHTQRVNVSWRLPDRFALTYPVTGIFAGTDVPAEPLVDLLGRNRARILTAAAEPVSTTALVAATGLALATVSDHLRVLTAAGLLERRRSGRSVLYWQSDTGSRVSRGIVGV
ncbi:winged helix-turn-helix transcriptional regulator [Kribbella sandramycini]|uniref:DNA-binding transcriptional ArsR family regulator n=1 Tax=Kribbella sandramycini TaxID=60450 RepID=A0A7Y4KYI4_9ACTN|nr:winged helix-turn-helix domain-containing protein [Kribbella sandramycini]MBB6569995.1 DNA-binding transcriptional ArsR family regulator [Kribbella sandramycini]NOL40181.1 winged helix-turn-helix transcriptional regulator [Kribbella sandramycini]